MAGKERGKNPSPPLSLFVFSRKKVKNGVKQEKYRRAKGAERWPGEGEKTQPFPFARPASPLASLADFFSFSPNAELGPRLLGFFRFCFPSAS